MAHCQNCSDRAARRMMTPAEKFRLWRLNKLLRKIQPQVIIDGGRFRLAANINGERYLLPDWSPLLGEMEHDAHALLSDQRRAQRASNNRTGTKASVASRADAEKQRERAALNSHGPVIG